MQVIGFLRAAVAVLHADLRGAAAAGYANKALAHILFALGELRVPFETVYPLVLQICDLLQTRVPTMDATCASPLRAEPRSPCLGSFARGRYLSVKGSRVLRAATRDSGASTALYKNSVVLRSHHCIATELYPRTVLKHNGTPLLPLRCLVCQRATRGQYSATHSGHRAEPGMLHSRRHRCECRGWRERSAGACACAGSATWWWMRWQSCARQHQRRLRCCWLSWPTSPKAWTCGRSVPHSTSTCSVPPPHSSSSSPTLSRCALARLNTPLPGGRLRAVAAGVRLGGRHEKRAGESGSAAADV